MLCEYHELFGLLGVSSKSHRPVDFEMLLVKTMDRKKEYGYCKANTDSIAYFAIIHGAFTDKKNSFRYQTIITVRPRWRGKVAT